MPFEMESNVLTLSNDFLCLSPPSKLKFAVLFCSIYIQSISFSDIAFWVIYFQLLMMIYYQVSQVSYCSICEQSLPLAKLGKLRSYLPYTSVNGLY